MTSDITQLVKKAAEAAKLAPEHLQEAAFNKVFDALLTQGSEHSHSPTRSSVANKSTKQGKQKPPKEKTGDTLDQLDRTAHHNISHTESGLNNSLRLLLAAKEDLGIDGLTAAQIAKTLVDKFRCKISRQAVSKVLNNAGNYVNRHKEGRLVLFRIMAPGEEYIADPSKTPKKRTGAKKNASKKSVKADAASKGKKSATATGSGAVATLSQLAKSDFFSTPKTISDIVDHCRHNLARSFKANDFSGKLARMIRAGELTREKNTDNQYEYKKA